MASLAPLAGVRVLVTRAAHQSGELIHGLESLGATVLNMPAIEIRLLPNAELDAALRELASFDWVCFASPNAVRVTLGRIAQLGTESDAYCHVSVAAVGRGTASVLEAAGVSVDLIPAVATGAALGEAMAEQDVAGARVLIPGSRKSHRDLDHVLTAAGAEVTRVDCYTSERPDRQPRIEGPIDIATFYSPSALSHTIETLGMRRLAQAAIVCIGETTAREARASGLDVTAIAKTADLDGMLAAVVEAASVAARYGG